MLNLVQYIGLTIETVRKQINGHRHDVTREKLEAQHAITHNLEIDYASRLMP